MVWERSLSYGTSIRELERCVDAIAFYLNYRYSPLFFFAPMKQSKGSLETLKSNWESLLQPFQLDPRVTQRVFLDLVTAYSSAARFYHTLEHIQHILEIINELRLLATNFPALQLAAWFHDAIYDSRANDNEEKSADYTVVALNQLEIPIVIIDRVKLLILTTKTHQALTTDLDSQILLDADLAILGADELDYHAYARAIRQEYSWVPDKLYQLRRKQLLHNFLNREKIYFTNHLFNKLEARARRNLQEEIAVLSE
ncbi:MAG: hypothetical protein LDL41_03450 [Coleofasciculus sp. S288]|nr:hypothetical protein [Coleofasciculus sp. S288]